MSRRWVHWACIAAAAVVYLITLSAAAPTLKEDVAAVAEKPLVRTKRDDEIIFNGQLESEGSRIKKSETPAKSGDELTKTDDANTSAANDKKIAEIKSAVENGKAQVENSGSETNQKETDEPTESEKQENDDEYDPRVVIGRVWDEEDDYGTGSEQRRRRRAINAVESKPGSIREERSAEQSAVAMVAENMAQPAARLQRAKRELLSPEEIRELIETNEDDVVPSYERAAGYNDYAGNAESELFAEPNVESVSGDVVGEGTEEEPYDEQGEDEEDEEEDEGPTDYFTSDDRRPKRGDEYEEAYDEAEREVIRELLAEKAAEETRQALIEYLTRGDRKTHETFPSNAIERYDLEDSLGSEDTGSEDTDESDDDGPELGGDEIIDQNDDRLDESPFLASEGPEVVDEQVEEKRFSYPYSYEPYGGRWGALVPGSKRSDRDPYDRLYRLAEALSRPSSIGDEEYKK